MDALRSTGVQDGRTTATQVGRWYAEGPEDHRFVAGDFASPILQVVSDGGFTVRVLS